MAADRFKLATQKAERFLRDRGVTDLPVDPIHIAESLDIVVRSKPEAEDGVSGMLLWRENRFGILYATHIKSKGFQNFCVAHELGHYLLEGHFEQLFGHGNDVHSSRAGFVSADPFEREADHFAAGLLMPDPMFTRALVRCSDGLVGIEELAEKCQTSVTATAIRYTEKTSAPVAVIMSAGERIEYCFMSKAMQEFERLERLRPGQPLPGGVTTDRFNQDPANVLNARRLKVETNLRDWFNCPVPVEANEEILGLGSYGKTLTVISASRFADDDDEASETETGWSLHY